MFDMITDCSKLIWGFIALLILVGLLGAIKTAVINIFKSWWHSRKITHL